MVIDSPVGHVAAKDVSKLVLVGASDMRVWRLVFQLDAVELGAPHDALLLWNRLSFPFSDFVLPLLKQQHGTGSSGDPFGQECRDRSIEQRRILGAIDEPGEIAIVSVRPTRSFFRQGSLSREIMDDTAGHVEDNVISTTGQPYQRIVLSAWHHESLCTPDLLVETLDAQRCVLSELAPELGPKADDEVHSSSRGSRFTDRSNCRGELLASSRVEKVELQVGMRGGSKSEDAGLRRVHAGIISG